MKIEKIDSSPIVTKPEKVVPVKNESKETPTAVYKKTEKQENIRYIYDKNTIDKVKRDSEKTYAQLRLIVEDMLKRQGKALNLIKEDELVVVDETARLEAQKLIGPNGPLGVEAVSQRIVDFAIALSGGDKAKLSTLRKAINEGFEEAEKTLGKLPDISRQTYDKIMEKLDTWEKEE
jgi:hypothetical protein